MRSARWPCSAALIAALLTGGAGPAVAQPADPKAAARELAEQAQDRTEAGDHAAALELLRKADATYHAPTIGLLIGRSLIALGRFAEAAEHLENVATEEPPEGAPEAFRTAVKLAGDERAALDGKLGKLVVQVSPEGAGATVRIDQRPVRPARGEHVVDAGKATEVRVEAAGYQPVVQRLTVAAGEGAVIAVTLQPIGEEAPPPPPPETTSPSRPFLHTPWPTVIGGGATALTFAIGAGLGAAAFSDASDLEERCGDASCSGASPAERAELRELQDSGRGTADASTVFFVVSGIAAAATTALVVVWVTSREESKGVSSARLRGGTGWATLDGSF